MLPRTKKVVADRDIKRVDKVIQSIRDLLHDLLNGYSGRSTGLLVPSWDGGESCNKGDYSS